MDDSGEGLDSKSAIFCFNPDTSSFRDEINRWISLISGVESAGGEFGSFRSTFSIHAAMSRLLSLIGSEEAILERQMMPGNFSLVRLPGARWHGGRVEDSFMRLLSFKTCCVNIPSAMSLEVSGSRALISMLCSERRRMLV